MVHRVYPVRRVWVSTRLRGHGGQNLQDDPLWCESEPDKVTSQ
jgi:hypothetical protein